MPEQIRYLYEPLRLEIERRLEYAMPDGALIREAGARPSRCPQWGRGQRGTAGRRFAMLIRR